MYIYIINIYIYIYMYVYIIYIYIYIQIKLYIYIYICKYIIYIRLPHRQSGDSQGHETFLAHKMVSYIYIHTYTVKL